MAKVSIDARDLRTFARAMRQMSPRLHREFRQSLIDGAEVIAETARALAGSDKIAETIKAGAHGVTAYVQAGNADVPEAALRELGNTGTRRGLLDSRMSGTFRHPVFGNRENWATQDMHRFLGPAALEKEDEAVDLLLAGVNRAAASVRLEME